MQDNLKSKAITSTIWKFSERILAQLVSLVVSIVIARILDPSDYSVVSLVTIFFTFANVIISGGLNTALIQKKDADIEDYSTVLHISVLISVLCYVLLFLFAPLIADSYNQEILIPVIRVMGLTLPVAAIKSIWCAYISSNLQFRKFFFATIGGTALSGIVGIVMAVNGYGAWALVAQQMTNTVIDTIILIITTRIGIVLKISISKLKVLFGYGWRIFVSTLIGTIYSEVSPLVIGIKYTGNDLSFYTKGKSFPSLLSTTTTNTLSAVLFPVIAKCQDNLERVLNCTRLFMRVGSFLLFPIMLGFFGVADNFVSIILTDKWLPCVYYIRLFCLVSMFDVLGIGNCETIKAIGRSDIYLKIEVIKKTLYFITLFVFITMSESPEVMALSYVVCTIICIIVNVIPNTKLIGYRIKDQIFDILPSFMSALIMLVFVMLLGKVNINIYAKTAMQVLSGMMIYTFMSFVVNRKTFMYILETIKTMIKR